MARHPPVLDAEMRVTRATWVTVGVALLIVTFSLAQTMYRVTRPTDGWRLDTLHGLRKWPVFDVNLLGDASPLRHGDVLEAVANQPLPGIGAVVLLRPRPLATWREGQIVRYTVRRQGHDVTVGVLLRRWPPALVLGWIRAAPLDPTGLPLDLLGLIAFGALFRARPGSRPAQLLVVFAAVSVAADLSALVPNGVDVLFYRGAYWPQMVVFTHIPWTLVILPLLAHLFLIFPVRHWPMRRCPRLTLAAIYGLTPLVVLLWTVSSAWSLPVAGLLSTVAFPLLILTPLLVALVSVGHALVTTHDPTQRAQIRWVAWGGLVAVAGGPGLWVAVAFGGLALRDPWLNGLVTMFFLALPVSLAVAILRYHLFAIDVILQRTLVYGALTLSIVTVYVLVVGALGALAQTRGSLLISLLAAGLVAALFQPLRERLQRGVNRLLYGERDDPYAVISRLARRLDAVLTPEAVLPAVVETVATALKLPYTAIALPGPEAQPLAAVYGTPTAAPLRLPLAYQGEPMGQLLVGQRTPHEAFSARDRRLLDDLARQAGVAAHAVRLSADVQRARVRLVTLRAEERRRLRRDLHDGLGPALAAVTLQAEIARDLLRSDPDQADALLVRLTQQAQDAIADIRRLVYDLRPPALDDLGLVGAVRAQGAHLTQHGVRLVITAPEDLPSLPAAVEVAAYRIIQEALANVARHAQARACAVRLSLSDTLTLEVLDDGQGLPTERRSGVGLHSMHERAAELGGACTVATCADGGVRVCAVLPIARVDASPTRGEEP